MQWQEQQALFKRAMDLNRKGNGKAAAQLFRVLVDGRFAISDSFAAMRIAVE